MQRKIYDELLLWKSNEYRKPLLLEGARQIGKTTIIKKFIKNEFDNFIFIDLENDLELTKLLNSRRLNAKELLATFELHFNKIINKDTILFLDEVQNVPYCITLLKYLNEEIDSLKIIASGSLISLKLNNSKISYPVGKIDHLYMYPMDFEEFLINSDNHMLLKLIKGNLISLNPINELGHQKLMSLYYDYLIVGGMPEAVHRYIRKGLNEATKIRRNILQDYREDISKYFDDKNVAKVLKIYDSIIHQLLKNNTKFQVSKINYEGQPSIRYREYEPMIINLVLSRIINKLQYIDKIFNPLIINTIDNSFKLFLNDVGFFSETVSLNRIQIDNNDEIWTNVKGGLTENFVYNELFKIRDVYCYKYVKKSHQKEIDFIMQGNNFNQIIIECKSSFNKRAVSFDNFIKTTDKIIAIKTSPTNFYFDKITNIKHIPLYAIGIYINFLYQNKIA